MIRHPDVTAHHLIGKLCVEMAQEVVEEMYSRNNAVYKTNKDRADLVKQIAPTLKAEAKQILAGMLGDIQTSEWEKERIYEALVMDNALPKGGTSIAPKSWIQ